MGLTADEIRKKIHVPALNLFHPFCIAGVWRWAAAFQIWVTDLVPPTMWDSIRFQCQAKMEVKGGARTRTP